VSQVGQVIELIEPSFSLSQAKRLASGPGYRIDKA